MKNESNNNPQTKAMPYDAMLAAGLFQSGKVYYCQHIPSREPWVILGISKNKKRVCVAGWPPTMANAEDCDNWEVVRDITDEEIEYRTMKFGGGWL